MSKRDETPARPNLFSLMDALMLAAELYPGLDEDALFDKAFELLEAAAAQREAKAKAKAKAQ